MILEERGWIAVDPLGVRPAWLGRPGGGVALAVEAQLKHLTQRLHHQPFAARAVTDVSRWSLRERFCKYFECLCTVFCVDSFIPNILMII